jgi:polyphosphate kinase
MSKPVTAAPKKATKTISKVSKPAEQAAESSPGKLKRKDYDKALKHLHVELVKLQQWVVDKGVKICIVFEGRDGAGKGGTIKAITERVSPRIFRVVALPAPTEREKTQMYVQRYLPHLPAGGEVVIFDRSWYNRAGVERVMGFTPEDKVRKFLKAVPFVENAMVNEANILLFKYWLEVSPDIQAQRLKDRIHDKRKIWKLSPMDVKSYTRWDDYTKARDEMFEATDTDFAPWYVAHSDDKKQVRIDIITHLLSQIPYEEVPAKKVKLPDRKVKKDDPAKIKKRKVVPSVKIPRSEEK